MSTEKPLTLSEQLKIKRQKEPVLEGDAEIKDKLKEIFNMYKTGLERINEILHKVGPYWGLISEEEKGRMLKSIQESSDITDENEFAERISSILKVLIDVKAERLDLFENIQRKQYYEDNPNLKELNQLFAYEVEEDEIRIHVPPNIGTSIKDKLKLISDGTNKLAEIVKGNPSIKRVAGRSWIVGENPNLLRKLGFSVSEFKEMPDGKKNALATISREELLKRYLNG